MAGADGADGADGAAPFVPPGADLTGLASAVQGCRGCGLYADATQAVFSRGPRHASVMLIGEEPGDIEDRVGEPFVGPAGRLLDKAMAEAGIAARDAYLTNAVKHFKFEMKGARRIHRKPLRAEVSACRPWLLAEFGLLTPKVVVALGAVAASALFGTAFRVTQQRGQVMPWPESADRPQDFPGTAEVKALATVHPSAVLRAEDRDEAYRSFVADLAIAAALLEDR